jgi:hypothetical protein
MERLDEFGEERCQWLVRRGFALKLHLSASF